MSDEEIVHCSDCGKAMLRSQAFTQVAIGMYFGTTATYFSCEECQIEALRQIQLEGDDDE